MSTDVEREIVFVGGPRDGEREQVAKAFWPLGNYYPAGPFGGPGGVWVGEHLAVDRARGHYRADYAAGCSGEPFPMKWYPAGTWTGAAWSCGWHDRSGDDPGGCPDCAYERHADDD